MYHDNETLRSDQTFRLGGPNIIAKDFVDETVIANLDTGLFYSLAASARAIWQALESGRSLEQIFGLFRSGGESAEERKRAIAQFIQRLRDENLIATSDMPVQQMVLANTAPLVYSAPKIESFDDLQGLLLVDPIHDVSEQGWPLLPDGSKLG